MCLQGYSAPPLVSTLNTKEVCKMDFISYLKHVGDDRASGYLLRNLQDRTGVHVSLAAMQAANGNAYHAMVLSQILYWFDINPKTREPRVSHERDGRLWVVKTQAEWSNELGFNSERTVAAALSALEDAGLIVKSRHKSPYHNGQVVTFISLEWSAWMNFCDEFYPGSTQDVEPGSTQDVDSGSTQDVEPSYTENTTESTPGAPFASNPFTDASPEDDTANDLAAYIRAFSEANCIIGAPSRDDVQGLRTLHEGGVSADEMRGFIEARKADDWWQDKKVSAQHILDNIKAWQASQQRTTGDWLNNVQIVN